MQAAPINRTRAAAGPNSSAGVDASLFGINLCDLLPEPLKSICHAAGGVIGTE